MVRMVVGRPTRRLVQIQPRPLSRYWYSGRIQMIKIDWAKVISKFVFFGWYYGATQKQWYRFKSDNHWQPIGLWITVYKRIYERYPDDDLWRPDKAQYGKIMITIDWQRFLKNRCWFGFWYAHPGLYTIEKGIIIQGHWRPIARNRWRHIIPMRLVHNSFPEDIRNDWTNKYDKIWLR